jgi:hypothetical protein
MNWDCITIGYAPYNKDYTAPGDRRRFIFYANEKKIKFNFADPLEHYDIVYLTYGSDLTRWLKYKKENPNVKFVFELIDSYLLESTNLVTILRGLIRYISGKESFFCFNYNKVLRKFLVVADAIVCSTYIQKLEVLKYNRNVHISLDYFSEDINFKKVYVDNNNKIKLVWEGQAYTVENLLLINSVLEKLKNKIELHIITDPVIKFPFNIFNRKTNTILKSLACQYYIYDWNRSDFCKIISNCDLAIIPISAKNSMMWHKPENKLLLFWEIGIPTLTTNTPAYKHVMNIAGLDFCCTTTDEWIEKIENYINISLENKKIAIQKANFYIQENHNKDLILNKWDYIFESLQNSLEKL